ncbi:MAG TPA: hypothetical protein VM097_11575, partial [Mycobacteriales bacterium]|nr:hypothetical protein [Mycobacteriales bacterium]
VAVVLAGVVVSLVSGGDTEAATPGNAVGKTLLTAGQAEQRYFAKHHTYTGSILGLTPLGFRPEKGVTMTILRADRGAYCLSAAKGTQVLYLSSASPAITPTACS